MSSGKVLPGDGTGSSQKSASNKVAPLHGLGMIHRRTITFAAGAFQADEEQQAYLKKKHSLLPCFKRPDREVLFCGNAIISTKYTKYNFFFKNLTEQITPWLKPANFYFLCIAILQCIKAISNTNGRPTIAMPLGFVVIITMIKDGLEEYRRYNQDKEKNGATYQVYNAEYKIWTAKKSSDLLVGDIIEVKDNDRFPADIFLIQSDIEKGTHAFVDTKALDGETNLKPKHVALGALDWSNTKDRDLSKVDFKLSGDLPDGDMSEWSASMTWMGSAHGQENLYVGHLCLMDCMLRNTPKILGVIAYTGDETKIRMNMAHHRGGAFKQSDIFRLAKAALVSMALSQIIICIISGVLSGYFLVNNSSAYYLSWEGETPLLGGFLSVCTWFIITKDMVPIALYVSLEITQLAQAIFLGWDDEMSTIDETGKRQGAIAQTSRLNEQLAQIKYIFSDKTGTLTKNSMEFKKAIIGKRQFGQGSTIAGIIAQAREENKNVMDAVEEFSKTQRSLSHLRGYTHPHVEFDEETIITNAMIPAFNAAGHTEDEIEEAVLITMFLQALALNNAIFPSKGQVPPGVDLDNPNNGITLTLRSSSPDETALAYFAQFCGFEIYSRQGGEATLRVTDHSTGRIYFQRFKEILMINFNSKRKRMTCVVQKILADGSLDPTLLVFCKGADSFVKKLIDEGKKDMNLEPSERRTEDNWQETMNKNHSFGRESLRCLVIACSTRDHSWYFGQGAGDPDSLKEQYARVYQAKGQDEKGHDAGACSSACKMCEIETQIEVSAHLDLVGLTAIEDKLQDGVPECIQKLSEAGIVIWVLTGDNVETAVNIGVSCNLIDGAMDAEGRLFKLNSDLTDCAHVQSRLAEYTAAIENYGSKANADFAVAIHGDVWKLILSGGQQLMNDFFTLLKRCKSVIACRLEPKEKADIVSIMRRREKCTCLAIGDGNNDAPMIKVADIGVGLRGVEGTSAAAVADYSFSQFRFLQKLLLVHGHHYSRRIGIMVVYIYYKGVMLVLMMVYFGFFSGFSGQMMILDFVYQLHNMAYTALPYCVFAVFDKDLSTKTLNAFPEIYAKERGPKGPISLTFSVFLQWMLMAISQSLLMFFIAWYSFETPQDSSGQAFGVWARGATVYSCLIVVSNVQLMVRFYSWTWIHWFVVVLTFIFFVGSVAIFSTSSMWALQGIDYEGLYFRLWQTPLYWLTLLVTCTACFVLDYVWVVFGRLLRPSRTDVYVEAERLGKFASLNAPKETEEGSAQLLR